MLNSWLASRPAYNIITLAPPGWSDLKSVRSYTFKEQSTPTTAEMNDEESDTMHTENESCGNTYLTIDDNPHIPFLVVFGNFLICVLKSKWKEPLVCHKNCNQNSAKLNERETGGLGT